MSMRRTRKIILWLLPLFALRGVVPAGTMLDIASDGRIEVVMCDGMARAAGGHIAHAHHHDHGNHSQHDTAQCPFAVAASAATTPSIPVLPAAVAPVRFVDVVDTIEFIGLFGPSRAQQSRAPPVLS